MWTSLLFFFSSKLLGFLICNFIKLVEPSILGGIRSQPIPILVIEKIGEEVMINLGFLKWVDLA